MKPDVIVTWPRNCDYPLWRQFIHDNRDRFNNVIIVFMEPNQGEDFRQFVRQAMSADRIHFIQSPEPGSFEDWRNVAVNYALMHSYGTDWIWFTEQDFFPQGTFWEDLQKAESEGAEVIAAYQDTRMHPCCIFVKKDVLNKTNRNFSIVPDKYDHFALIQKQLEEQGIKIGVFSKDTYKHYNGLSHNFRLVSIGEEPVYEPEEFRDYLTQCLNVKVDLDPRFLEIVKRAIKLNV